MKLISQILTLAFPGMKPEEAQLQLLLAFILFRTEWLTLIEAFTRIVEKTVDPCRGTDRQLTRLALCQ